MSVRAGGVAESGMYTIRVKAAAIDRDHPYGDALDDFRNGDPLVLEVAMVDREGSVESTGSIDVRSTRSKLEGIFGDQLRKQHDLAHAGSAARRLARRGVAGGAGGTRAALAW